MSEVQEMTDLYFEHLVGIIRFVPSMRESERILINRSVNRLKILKHLHAFPFQVILSDDENRVKDALTLRKDWIDECGVKDSDDLLRRHRPFTTPKRATILEVMVALSKKMEDQIMTNTQLGDRTGFWFWSMIESLGIINMTDNNFDEDKMNKVIHNMISRRYDQDGRGGLFTCPRIDINMRQVSIWYQAMFYLNQFKE